MLHYFLARNISSLNHVNNINRANIASLMLLLSVSQLRVKADVHSNILLLALNRSFLLTVASESQQ